MADLQVEHQAHTHDPPIGHGEVPPSEPKPENSNGDITHKSEVPFQPQLAVPEKSTKKRSLLPVPSRSSSNIKRDQSSASSASGKAHSTDEAENTERSNARRGIMGRRREGSRASSRHSRSAQRDTQRDQVAEHPASTIDNKEKAEKKGARSFLSFLNCCTRSDGTDAVEPPTKKELSKASRPVTAAEKAGNATVDQKAAGVAHANPEKSPSAEAEGHSSEKAPKQVTKVTDTPMRTRSMSREKSQQQPPLPSTPNASMSEKQNQQLPPLPPSPPVNALPRPNESEKIQEASAQAIPGTEKTITSDSLQSPLQGLDSDVEMPDAPLEDAQKDQPLLPVPVQSDDAKPKNDLPPPPPTVPKDNSSLSAQAPPLPPASQENQQWLLPPVKTSLKGRKCLVLDLDETLVHSSFKVCEEASEIYLSAHIFLDIESSGFYDPSRNRGPIP